MGNYYCSVRNFGKSFFCSWRTKTRFWSPKSCLNDATTAIILNQSNHQHFLVMVHSQRKVEVQYCNKRLSFPGVIACNLIFFRHFDRFSPKGGNRIYCHYSYILMKVNPTYNSSWQIILKMSIFHIGNHTRHSSFSVMLRPLNWL